MDFEQFKRLNHRDQQMQVINLMVECRKAGHSWEVAVEECRAALRFATDTLKALGRGSDSVEAVLTGMVLIAYETLARKELGEE